jgi:hypothetical protein
VAGAGVSGSTYYTKATFTLNWSATTPSSLISKYELLVDGKIVAARAWAVERNRDNLAAAHAYLAGEGPFPERTAQTMLVGRFLTDFYLMVAAWAELAAAAGEDWPPDPHGSKPDAGKAGQMLGRARPGARSASTNAHAGADRNQSASASGGSHPLSERGSVGRVPEVTPSALAASARAWAAASAACAASLAAFSSALSSKALSRVAGD